MNMQMSNIQWFPGHMTKTKRQMEKSMPLVDIVVEILDARIPLSSRNPDLNQLTANKPKLVLLNKSDIADDTATKLWIQHFQQQETAALAIDCKTGRGISGFYPLIRKILADRIAQWKEKGLVNRPIKMMIVGIPNSGKSSFINRMARGGKAKVEDRPGVTKDNKWFVASDGSQMLDTPGVLWPKFEDQTVAQHLAYTGAIRDEILNTEELACGLLEILRENYDERLSERYKLSGELPENDWDLLQLIGKKRGMMISGGEVDTERASIMLLDEFRGGKIGRITLERP